MEELKQRIAEEVRLHQEYPERYTDKPEPWRPKRRHAYSPVPLSTVREERKHKKALAKKSKRANR